MKKTYKQMINTFKHGEYFYKFNGKVNGGYCWWKCDIADFDLHENELRCVSFRIMSSSKFTRKQLLEAFDNDFILKFDDAINLFGSATWQGKDSND
jgi:hypothetical protein